MTELRNAATCPRIHYFDLHYTRENGLRARHQTRVWLKTQKSQAGGGALFHHVVERFNRMAPRDSQVRDIIDGAQGATELQQGLLRYVNNHCINLDKLSTRPVPLRQALIGALTDYFAELADLINYALSNRIAPGDVVDQLFGDNRRRVDMTFHLSQNDQVHVTGSIDYIFYDWRTGTHRVIDYKLLAPHRINRDLFQVCAYALMHHHQHGTKPDVAVFYRHPKRHTVALDWEKVRTERVKIYNLLSSMVAWEQFDEASAEGLRPPGDVTWCEGCKWNRNQQCEKRLGPKDQGAWSEQWDELSSMEADTSPLVEAHTLLPIDPALDLLPDEPDLAEFENDNDDETTVETEPSQTAQPQAQPSAPDDGLLFIGHRTDRQTSVKLEPKVINTHMAVVGAAGSGKTWTAKVLAEEVAAAGVPVIAVDPQGDLVQLMLDRDTAGLTAEQAEAQRRFRSLVQTRIYTPGTSHGIRLSLNPIRLPSSADLARITKEDRRNEEESGMLQAVASNLVSLANVGGEQDSQRTFIYQVLQSLNREANIELREVVAAILKPDVLGIEDVDFIIKKAERERLARKLNTFVIGPASNLFRDGLPLDLDLMTKASDTGKIPLNIIYLNALTDDEQKHFFLASLASEIYRWMISSLDATKDRPNLLFYIDEARDWIPAGNRTTPAKQPLIRLFTQGRKYGVGCLLCTQ
ncbi:MAG: helicase HerA-like domain-containing protein, partial [Myxococcota bacterium]